MFMDSEKSSGARHRFETCMEHFLDAYKEHALASAFTEPARFYWAQTAGRPECPSWLEENVEAHALNWYVAMLGRALAASAPATWGGGEDGWSATAAALVFGPLESHPKYQVIDCLKEFYRIQARTMTTSFSSLGW
eukprot:g20456.t1